ncbi:MAG: hypothetical protein QHJ81_12785 [Anaerolineae bacterium]|nr:hypothetical protein [Anaerolineae bacterium]
MTKTIIIAVHDPNILYLLQRYAEESGFWAVSALGGKDVLAMLACQPDPALLILDVELPGLTSPEIWHSLKAEAATRHIPVVFYSSLDEPGEEWHDGVSAYLPNPVMYDDFVATLKRAGICLESALS